MLCAFCDSGVRNRAGEMLVLRSEPKNVKQSQFRAEDDAPQRQRGHRDECKCFF